MLRLILSVGAYLLLAIDVIVEEWYSGLVEVMLRITSFRLHTLRRSKHIKRAPGSRIQKIAEFLCSQRTMRLTVKPLIAEWQWEYFEALRAGAFVKARWINLRYYFASLKTFGLLSLVRWIKNLGFMRL
jgi:hypothetical protein